MSALQNILEEKNYRTRPYSGREGQRKADEEREDGRGCDKLR